MARARAKPTDLQQFLGRRILEIRLDKDWSRDRLAERARAYVGLNWTRRMVAKIESGERDVTLEEFLALLLLLMVPLAELFPQNGRVGLSTEASVDAAMLWKLLKGDDPRRWTPKEIDIDSPLTREIAPQLAAIQQQTDAWTEAVADAAKALSKKSGLVVTPERLEALSQQRWGHSFLEERERRLEDAGAGATRGRRGWESRRLVDEVLAAKLPHGTQTNSKADRAPR